MLKAEALDGIVQLDVDSEVVGIELQLVILAQASTRVDGQPKGGHRWGKFQFPMSIAVGIGIEADGCLDRWRIRHLTPLP